METLGSKGAESKRKEALGLAWPRSLKERGLGHGRPKARGVVCDGFVWVVKSRLNMFGFKYVEMCV